MFNSLYRSAILPLLVLVLASVALIWAIGHFIVPIHFANPPVLVLLSFLAGGLAFALYTSFFVHVWHKDRQQLVHKCAQYKAVSDRTRSDADFWHSRYSDTKSKGLAFLQYAQRALELSLGLVTTFGLGQPVTKPKGYAFPGTVRSVFLNGAGHVRYVVESLDTPGLLHIYSDKDLEAIDLPDAAPAGSCGMGATS